MAHECPNCGLLCHCHGDIDDLNFGPDDNCLCDCVERYREGEDDEENDYDGLFIEPDYDLENPKQ